MPSKKIEIFFESKKSDIKFENDDIPKVIYPTKLEFFN